MSPRRGDGWRADTRSRDAVLSAAAHVLVNAPQSSLSEVSAAIGVGRTTLHRMFATRSDLLLAIADDAVQHLSRVYADAGLGTDTPGGDDLPDVLRRLVEHLIPLGPKLMFLLRAPELRDDDALARRIELLDEPLRAAISRATHDGVLRTGTPDWWATEMLFAGVFVAWEQIETGRLAPRDAPTLVMRTWLNGVAAAVR